MAATVAERMQLAGSSYTGTTRSLSQLQVQHEFEWQDCESLTRDFKLLGRAGGSPGGLPQCRPQAGPSGPSSTQAAGRAAAEPGRLASLRPRARATLRRRSESPGGNS